MKTDFGTAWVVRLILQFLPEKWRKIKDLDKILDNTLWLFLDKGVRLFTGMFVGAWVARYLQAEQYGLLSYAVAITTIAGSLVTLGMESIVLREILRNPHRQNEYLGSAFVFRFVAGLAVMLFLFGGLFLINPQDNTTLLLVGIISLSFLLQPIDLIDCFFQAQLASRYTIVARTVALILVSLIKIAFILTKKPLEWFAFALFLEYAMAYLAYWVAYRIQKHQITNWTFQWETALYLLRQSWTLMFSTIFVILNMQFDKIMLKTMHSDSEVGLYTAAAKLSELWYFVPVFLGGSLIPKLVNSFQTDKTLYFKQLQKIYKLMTAISVGLGVFVFLTSEYIIAFVFGEKFSLSAPILAVHIWSAVFIFHVSIRSRALIVEGLQHFVGLFSMSVLLSNLLFNYWLIPDYGGLGAAYASLLSWALSALFVPLANRKTRMSSLMFLKSFWF